MAAKDVEAGRAHVLVVLRDQVSRGLDRVGKHFSAFGKGFAAVGAGLTAGGAAIVTPLLAAASAFSTAGDAIQKMSIRTQSTAEFLSEMKFAAEQSGTSIEVFGNAMFKANRQIANATTGTGPAVRALQELGLEANLLNAMPTDKKFNVLADALSQMKDQTRAAQLGFELFGTSFRELQPLISEGSAGIAKLRAEAQSLGLTLSTDDANAAAVLNDAMGRATSSIAAGWMKVGAAVAPALSHLLDVFSGVVVAVTSWVDANRPLFATLLAIGGVIGAVGVGFTTFGGVLVLIGASMSALIPLITALTPIIAGLSLPVVAVSAAIAGALVLTTAIAGMFVYAAYQSGLLSEAMTFLGRAFGRLLATAQITFGGIAKALAAGQYVLAARILWAGIKLAFWQGVGSSLNAMKYLWTNAFSLQKRFFESFLTLSANVFSAIPTLLWSAIKGGASLASIISDALTGDIKIDDVVSTQIKGARAELDGLLKQLPRGQRPQQQSQQQPFQQNQRPQQPQLPQQNQIEGPSRFEQAVEESRRKLEQAVEQSQAINDAPDDPPEVTPLREQVRSGNAQASSLASAGTFSAAGAALSLGFNSRPQEETAKNTKLMVALMKRREDNLQNRFGK